MQRIAKKIEARIRKSRKGTIYFHSDFSDLGDSETIRRSLNRLCASGVVRRCARGMFYIPKIDRVFGMGEIPISDHEIAKAYARKMGIAIFATDVAARNMLGLSEQNQMNAIYYTDGRTDAIDTENGSIRFVHATDKHLKDYSSENMRLLCLALNGYVGRKINEEDRRIISRILSSVNEKDFNNDIKLMKTWKRDFLISCR